MKEKQRRHVIVGIFVVFGISLFVSAVYLIGTKEYLFGRPYKIFAVFSDVKGLQVGDKVRMSGIDIGTVSALSFTEANKVLIQLNIEQEQFTYINSESIATLGSQGLMGAKVVKILPGKNLDVPVQESDTLKTIEQIEIDDIIREVNKSSGNLSLVSEQLVSITQKINRGDGVFGKLFIDTTLMENLDETISNLSLITYNFNKLSERVNRGEGIVGKLFADTSLTKEIDKAGANVDQITMNLMEITDKINRGEGVFGKIFTDTSLTKNLSGTSENLLLATSNLVELSYVLNNDSSALNLLLNDPSFADSLELVIERLQKGIVEATEAAEAIQNSGLIKLGAKKKRD